MFRPILDQILVKPNKQNDKTPRGLTIPESVLKETPMTGTVVSIGNGVYHSGFLVPLQVAVNDTVTWMPYCGREITWDNDKLVILRESEIMGVL